MVPLHLTTEDQCAGCGVYDALRHADPPRRSRARRGVVVAIALGRLRGRQGELKYRTARFIRLCPQPAPNGKSTAPSLFRRALWCRRN